MLTRYLAWTDRVLAGEARGWELVFVWAWVVSAVVGIAFAWHIGSFVIRLLVGGPALALVLTSWMRRARRLKRTGAGGGPAS